MVFPWRVVLMWRIVVVRYWRQGEEELRRPDVFGQGVLDIFRCDLRGG